MDSLAKNIQDLSTQFIPLIMALVFHEYAHGFVARLCGDKTAEEQGRLTLNPLPHLDPMGSVVMPILFMLSGLHILFGWAKPVPIDPRRFRRFRSGLFFVSIAGVSMNVLLAFLSSAAFVAILMWMPPDFYLFEPLKQMSIASVSLNYMLALFNLIPLPPLDGSKVVEAFLPRPAMRKFEQLSKYSFFILLALIFTGSLQYLSRPLIFCSVLTIKSVAWLFGAPELLDHAL